MATTFTGLRVQDTYNAILKIGDNSNLSGTAKIISDGVGNSSSIYLSTTRFGIGITPAYQFHTSGNAKIGGNLIISGDLTVNGSTTIIDSTIIAIGDNMIEMAKDNVANTKDIGWYGTIVESGTKYAGMAYDASTGITAPKFNLGLGTVEPGNTFATTVTGTLIANLEGNVTGTVSSLSNHDTNDLVEGSVNLYYTNARADARVNLQTGVNLDLSNKDTDDLSEGSTNLYFTTARARASFSAGDGITITNGVIASEGDAEVAKRIDVTVKNVSGGSLAKGVVVHAAPTATPPSGNVIEVVPADANVVASMPAIGVLNETIANEAEGEAVMFGAVSGIDTSSFSIGDELYVSETAGEFTAIKPTAFSSQVQKIAVVIKSHASNGLIKVFGAGRANDVPNRVDRDMNFTDGSKLEFGTDSDLEIYHDGTDGYIDNINGELIIQNNSNDKKIIFKSDNGIGDITEYFRIDGNINRNVITATTQIGDNTSFIFGSGTGRPYLKYDSTATQLFISGNSKFLNDLFVVGNSQLDGFVFSNGEGNGFMVDAGTAATARTGFMKYGQTEGQIISGNNTKIRLTHRTDSNYVYGGTPTIREDLVIDTSGNSTFYGTITSGAITTPQINLDNSGGGIINNQTGNIFIQTPSGSGWIFRDGPTGYAEKMRLGSDGNLSVGDGGTGARNARLLLNNAGSQGTPQLMLVDSDDSGKQSEIRFDSGNLIFDYWGGTSRSEYLRIKSDGDVGINVTDPQFKLDIADDVTGVVLQLKSSSTSGAGLYIDNDRTGSKKFGLLVGNVAAGAFSIKDEDAGVNRLVIDTSGFVGIANETPSKQLEVAGDIGVRIDNKIGWIYNPGTDNNMYNYLKTANDGFGLAASFLEISGANWTSGNTASVKFTHSTYGDIMTLMTVGNLGLGTNNPSTKLNVSGGSGNPADDTAYNGFLVAKFQNAQQSYVEIRNTANANGAGLVLKTTGLSDYKHFLVGINNDSKLRIGYGTGITNSKDGSSGLTILQNGSVGVGTANPSGASGNTIAINGGAGQARLAIKNDATGDGSDDGFQIGIGVGGEVFIEQRENSSMQFTTNNLERIKIDNSGYVNIKQKQNSGLGYDLLINIGTSPDGKIGYQTQDQLAANLAVNANSNWIKTGNNIYNSNSANVGIGTTTIPSDHILQISNDSQSYARVALTNSQTGNASGDGLIFQMENLNSIIKNQENGSLVFGTNGRESDLKIDSSGRVGINMSTGIDANLRVDANSAILTQEILKVKGGGSGGNFGFLVEANNGEDLFKVDTLSYNSFFTNGNLGVNTTTPVSKLHVQGGAIGVTTGQKIGWIYNPGSNNNMYNYISTADNGGVPASALEISGSNWTGGNVAGVKFTHVTGGEIMTLMTGGNVGISQTSPTNGKLEIQQTATTAALWVQTGGTTNSYSVADFRTGTNLSALKINGDGNSLFGGNIGVNTSSPNVKLQVNATGGNISSGNAINGSTMKGIKLTNTLNDNSSVGLWFGTNNVHWSGITGQRNDYTSTWGTDLRFYTHNNATSSLSSSFQRMIITSEGRVGILTSTPGYTLDVTGTIRATSDVIAFSDKRVKENIVTINSALEKVTKLRGVTYTRKDIEDKSTKVGVIAQEVLEVLPEVVETDNEGMYSVAYGNMAGVFIEAIKELKAEVDSLKQEIKQLKK